MPRDDELRQRLEKYLGGSLRPGEGSPPVRRKSARAPRSSPLTSTAAPPRSTVLRAELAAAVPGYAVRVPERGSAYKVITPVSGDLLRDAFLAAFSSPETPTQQRMQARCRATALPEEVLFFDLETTGLGQTPLFLIGTMSWEQDNLIVRQLFARDAGEEAAVIQLFVEMITEKRFLISFNGKSFDLPMVYQRAETHGLPCVIHASHFDLLHECRQAWRAQLPNCQLQTLEEQICGRPSPD